MADEHRSFPRQPLHVDFRAQNAAGAGQLLFEGLNLSAGGCFLRSELLLEQGETLVLEFRVPGVPRLMRAQARVAWVRRFPKDGEDAGMGIEFLSMSDDDRRLLEAYFAGS